MPWEYPTWSGALKEALSGAFFLGGAVLSMAFQKPVNPRPNLSTPGALVAPFQNPGGHLSPSAG